MADTSTIGFPQTNSGFSLGDLFSTNSLPYWMTGLAALTGYLGNRGGTTTSQQTTNANTTGTTNSINRTTTNLNPLQQTSQDVMLQKLIDNAKGGYNNVLNAYRGTGLQQIQQSYDAKNQMLQNLMKARGLGNAPASVTPQLGLDTKRLEDISALNTSIPLMRQQMQTQALDQLMKGFAVTPKDTTTTGSTTSAQQGTTNTTGSITTPGNPLGGALAGLLSALPFLYSTLKKNQQQQQQQAPSPYPGTQQGRGSAPPIFTPPTFPQTTQGRQGPNPTPQTTSQGTTTDSTIIYNPQNNDVPYPLGPNDPSNWTQDQWNQFYYNVLFNSGGTQMPGIPDVTSTISYPGTDPNVYGNTPDVTSSINYGNYDPYNYYNYGSPYGYQNYYGFYNPYDYGGGGGGNNVDPAFIDWLYNTGIAYGG